MLYLLGLAAVFFAACRSQDSSPQEKLPSKSLPLDLAEADSIPGLKPKLEEVHRLLREAGISDEQMDREAPLGSLQERDLFFTTIDHYQRYPKNEKLKKIVDGPFKEIAQTYYIKGLEDYLALGPCTNAFTFARAVFYDPSHQRANYYDGYCGRDAVSLRRALALDSTDKKAWEALSQTLLDQDRLPEAEVAAVEWLRLDMENPKASQQLGSIYLMEGELPLAVEAFEQSIRLEILDGISHLGLGFALFLQGEEKSAEREFWTASSLDANINISLISFLTRNGYLKLAKRHLWLLFQQVPLLQKEIAETISQIEEIEKITLPSHPTVHAGVGIPI